MRGFFFRVARSLLWTMVRPIPVLPMQRGPLPAECRVPPHALAIARTVPLLRPWRFSGIPQQSGLRGCKPYNGLQDMAAISAEGDTALHPPLDTAPQLPEPHQRENRVNHRPAAAFDQLARVVPQLADQPLPPPPQPPDRSTNIVQREQPRLCLYHEALLFCCRSRGSLGQCPAARVTKRLTKLADSSGERA